MNSFNVCVYVCVQVQATVVGFLASIAAVIFGWLPEGQFRLGHAVLLCASSVATAFIASLLLGMFTVQEVCHDQSKEPLVRCVGVYQCSLRGLKVKPDLHHQDSVKPEPATNLKTECKLKM